MNDERWTAGEYLSPRVHKFPLLNGTSTAPVITAHFNIPGNTSCLPRPSWVAKDIKVERHFSSSVFANVTHKEPAKR